MAQVYDYKDYTVKLKEWFDMTKDSISDEDIQEFINYYNLFKDYKIIINDVRKDINRNKSKYIRSYKEYIIKLKIEFGRISSVPDEQDIQKFIKKYYLDSDWDITADLVKVDISNILINKQNNKDLTNIDETSKNKSDIRILKLLEERKKLGIDLVSKHKADLVNNISYRFSYNFEEVKSDYQINSYLNSIKNLVLITQDNRVKTPCKKTFLIDGDNHFDEGKKGIERKKKDVEIIAFFSQEGAYNKFYKKYKERPNVKAVPVTPGPQAVDNRIKTHAGQLLSEGNQDITIVSQDKGYNKYIKKNNHIKLSKSVK